MLFFFLNRTYVLQKSIFLVHSGGYIMLIKDVFLLSSFLRLLQCLCVWPFAANRLFICVCRRPPQMLVYLRPYMLCGLGSCWMTPQWKQHWRLCVSIQPTAQQVCRRVSPPSDSTSVCVCLCGLCASPVPVHRLGLLFAIWLSHTRHTESPIVRSSDNWITHAIRPVPTHNGCSVRRVFITSCMRVVQDQWEMWIKEHLCHGFLFTF